MKFKTNLVVQSCGLEVSEADIVAKIKEIWVNDGKLVKDIKALDMYVKPEEKKVYYIIDGDVNGDLDI